ncbi:hypothetical protein WMY93_022952 [Mugilogobius chulae]|uniref:Uncharacterized protein n=1 Tax=Mugilogobius chulae TaxID=88201 RepID=A0AAW0N9S8_9GOBI
MPLQDYRWKTAVKVIGGARAVFQSPSFPVAPWDRKSGTNSKNITEKNCFESDPPSHSGLKGGKSGGDGGRGRALAPCAVHAHWLRHSRSRHRRERTVDQGISAGKCSLHRAVAKAKVSGKEFM